MAWVMRPRLVFPDASEELAPAADRGVHGGSVGFKTIDYFLNEKLDYDISFLWFRKAASGSVTFSREGDGYKAVLQAETKGFVGFFTSYRKHRYVSHLAFIPETGKFRVSLFERLVIIGKKEEKTLSRLDYGSRMVSWQDYKNGKLVEETSEPIPEGTEYEDILSAFYNFRLGLYGPVSMGRSFQVKTIPEKGESVIDVNIPGEEEAGKMKRLFGLHYDESLVYVKVRVPREIFKSKKGEIYVWIDERIVPVKGIVKDYIGFGDIRGTLQGWRH